MSGMAVLGTILLIAAVFAGGAGNIRGVVPPLRIMAAVLAAGFLAGGSYQDVIAAVLLLALAGLYLPGRLGETVPRRRLRLIPVAGFASVALALLALRLDAHLGASGALGLAVLLFGLAVAAAGSVPMGLLIAAEGCLFTLAARPAAPDALFAAIILLAILLALILPEAPLNPSRRRIYGAASLGGALFAAAIPDPSLAWGGLALASLAGTILFRRNRARMLAPAGLIIALFGLAVAGSAPVAAGIALLIGYGALACGFLGGIAVFAMLPPAALLAAAHAEILPGGLWIASGAACLILGTVMLARRRDFVIAATLGQSGLALIGFGFGGGQGFTGGTLLLAALAVARLGAALAAAFPVHPARRMIGNFTVMALAGLPPFGAFAGIFLILSDAARHSAWFAGLLALLVLIFMIAAMARYATADPAAAAKAAPARGPLLASGLALAILAAFGIVGPFLFASLIGPA
ncbi:MAG TPA: hypothetical protein VFN77_00280 [Acetobacteraceae bacterium]|nr:hypothetical protein [Acetobacteraceae bacterium]